jgi:NADPH:quinone reductase-like Zn-dependent oxidoreductase
MAKALGATAIATTRNPDKVSFLREVGADHVIVTTKGVDFAPEMRAATDGRGVDLVFDPVSGTFMQAYVNGLNWAAKVLIYGQLDDRDPTIPILPITRVKGSIHAYSMFNHVMFADQLAEGIAFVMRGIAEGRFRPVIDRVFSLDQTKDAYSHMLGNSH